MRFVRSLTKACHRLAVIFNAAGVSFLALIMLLISLNIVMRFIQKPIPGAVELAEFMQLCLVFLAIAYTQVQRGHVSIDFLVKHFSPRAQAILDSIINLLALCFFTVMTWQSVLRAWYLEASGSETMVLHLPLFPLLWVVAAGSALMCLVLLVDLLHPLIQGGKNQ